jgi:hypothetical protein
MRDLGFALTDVEDCLCALSVGDCNGDGAPDHPELAPDGWVYWFVTDFLSDDPPMYVKVILNPKSVYVLSFKSDGSPA